MKKIIGSDPNYNRLLTVRIYEDIQKDPGIHRFTTKRIHLKYGISERTLERYFSRIYHEKYKDFLHETVLARAELLIAGHQETLEEIAGDLEYSSQYTLQTALKRRQEKKQKQAILKNKKDK
jgi:AraC-like DNA-binding protein